MIIGITLMESFPVDTNDTLSMTQTQHISEVHTEFLPEKDIPTDSVLREDYEKLRITYELQRDIGSEIEIDFVLNRILDRTLMQKSLPHLKVV